MRSKILQQAAIAAGAALSGAVNLSDKVLCAIIMPAVWTAAALTFQASDDGGLTWYSVYDDQGNEITIVSTVAIAGVRLSMDPSNFASISAIKVRSGAAATPVNQTYAATIGLVSRKYYALD